MWPDPDFYLEMQYEDKTHLSQEQDPEFLPIAADWPETWDENHCIHCGVRITDPEELEEHELDCQHL